MRVFKNKEFNKWAKKLKIKDSALINAVDEMKRGLYDAKLGMGIYKKRIAHGSRGKSGGVRTILAFHLNKVAIFILGYKKNELDNISNVEESALKDLAKIYLSLTQEQLDRAVKKREFIEVRNAKINIKNSS